MKRVSASFGDDIWEAKNYGQVTYAVKTRNGAVYMELESRCAPEATHHSSLCA